MASLLQYESGGKSPNESQNSITDDRHAAHPWRHSIRCTRRVACRLHSARSAQPATTGPCRSLGRTRDGKFGAPTIGRAHGHVASLDWGRWLEHLKHPPLCHSVRLACLKYRLARRSPVRPRPLLLVVSPPEFRAVCPYFTS